MLAWIGLGERETWKAGALPYTDQRRLGIARGLVLSPAFILLDEPAAGMSDAECEHLMELVASIPGTFTCGVLLIEHNMRVVMGISQRIHVLDGGRTLAEGLARPRSRATRASCRPIWAWRRDDRDDRRRWSPRSLR